MAKLDPKKAAERMREEITRSQKVMDRILDKQGIFPVRDLYESEVDKVQKSLRRTFRGKLKQDITVTHRDTMLKTLRKKTLDIALKVGDTLAGVTKMTLKESAHSASAFLFRMSGKSSLIDDPITESKIIRKFSARIAKMREQAAANTAKQMSESLQRAMVIRSSKPQTIAEYIEGVEVAFESQWWRLERLVRTETAIAYNAMQAEIIAAAEQQGLPDIYMRWTELIDDFTGKPFDNRVATDSMELHGQVAKPGNVFTMPSTSLAPKRMHGQSWVHPPNRPNDRAVLTPWHKSWGISSWKLQNGQRVPVTGK